MFRTAFVILWTDTLAKTFGQCLYHTKCLYYLQQYLITSTAVQSVKAPMKRQKWKIREADVFLSPSSRQIASPARELKTSTCATAYMHKVYVGGHSKMLRWTVNSKNGWTCFLLERNHMCKRKRQKPTHTFAHLHPTNFVKRSHENVGSKRCFFPHVSSVRVSAKTKSSV